MAIRDLGKLAIDVLKPDGTTSIAGSIQTILNAGSVSKITGLTLPKATDLLKNGGTSTVTDPLKAPLTKQKNLHLKIRCRFFLF